MIVHHKNPQFVYYAPSKTGTTSVGKLLKSMGCKFKLTHKHDISPPNPKTLDYFFFITVRNPFSRLVSIYRYAQQREKRGNPTQEAVHEVVKDLTFRAFVDKFVVKGHMLLYYPDSANEELLGTITYTYLLTPQANYLKAMPKQDLIIRMESFNDDVRRLPFLGVPAKVKIPRTNTTKHGPWQKYYTGAGSDVMIEEIVEHYKEDFELLGYSTEVK